MIEAVNSVLSNAPLTKQVVEQQSVARSFAANPARIQEASMQAPYISLYIKVDTYFDKAVLQIRDSDTGDVVRQIPTESQLEAYRRAQTSNAVRSPSVEKDFELTSDNGPELQSTAPTTTGSSMPAQGGGDVSAPTSAPAPQAPQTQSVDTSA